MRPMATKRDSKERELHCSYQKKGTVCTRN